MLQILGEAMMIATRTDDHLHDLRNTPARPLRKEAETPKTRRQGWLKLAGLIS